MGKKRKIISMNKLVHFKKETKKEKGANIYPTAMKCAPVTVNSFPIEKEMIL